MFGILNTNKSQKIKGTVVLMPKNVLDFNAITSIPKGSVLDAPGKIIGGVTGIVGGVVDTATAFLGRNVSMQLISATKTDAGGKGQVGKETFLSSHLPRLPTLGARQDAFSIYFEYDANFGIPGAFYIRNYTSAEFFLVSVTLEDIPNRGSVQFVCNSWIYNFRSYQKDRIFFTNDTYLPSQTPAALSHFRKEELLNLRGDGTGERKVYDRIYDYDVYNDLGNPDYGDKFVRPVLGGSSTYPYPRRVRSGRKSTRKDPKSEKQGEIYVPRDENFGHLKSSDFLMYGIKSISQTVMPLLKSVICDEFSSFEDVRGLYEGGIKLPTDILTATTATAAARSSQTTFSDGVIPSSSNASEPSPKVQNNHPRTTSSGFDHEALVRGVKALKEIAASPNPKKIFEILMKQEETKQAEFRSKVAEFHQMKAQQETEKQRIIYDEEKKLAQHQAQTKSQMAKYEDELARKRMQAENEQHRVRNQELVKMQEDSSIRLEQARRATEEQIQAQRRQTEKEKAEIERETIRISEMAGAEARAHEAKLSEEVNRRILIERGDAEREKWISIINTTFDHVGEGFRTILTDRNKLVVAVGGVTALAAGVYTTREGARVIWGYVDRILGQPSLIRESSRGKYPWSGAFSRAKSTLSRRADPDSASKNGKGFGDVILHPSLNKRIEQLAYATANTKAHQAPFRNMLFYGPPGTGKTMAARELAHKSGLDYALMTGGDVAPLGSQAVTKIHQLFDWAKKSNRGLLLFIDEADAFLCERNKTYMSEAQRSALNALLFRTGDQSKDIVLALATNRPGDLDSAVADRIDEVLEFPLPGEEERFKLLKLYLDKYIAQAGSRKSGLLSFKANPQKIEIKGLTDDIIKEAAAKTDGFSGREIAKLMASVQAAVYGSDNCVLDSSLFREVVDYKVAEHQQRIKLAGSDKN